MNGGNPPKGILLYGFPGTGKTLFARAMAGESDVTFLQTSATEFMGRYVGRTDAFLPSFHHLLSFHYA